MLLLSSKTQLNLKTMYQPKVYIKRTYVGYYVCYSALRSKYINVNPFHNMAEAMRFAWEAVASYRTRQNIINVYN